jgi:hypothetical protein
MVLVAKPIFVYKISWATFHQMTSVLKMGSYIIVPACPSSQYGDMVHHLFGVYPLTIAFFLSTQISNHHVYFLLLSKDATPK